MGFCGIFDYENDSFYICEECSNNFLQKFWVMRSDNSNYSNDNYNNVNY